MGLISGLLLWPLAPIRGVVWVGEKVQEEAERQWSDPAVINAALMDIEAMRESGDITEEEADAREEELVQRLLGSSTDSGQTVTWEGREEDE